MYNPDDNPYAAPQSDLSPVNVPMAEEVLGRQLFPELATKELGRLFDYSMSLRVWSNLSILYAVINMIVIMAVNFSPFVYFWMRIIVVLPLPCFIVSVWADRVRGQLMRRLLVAGIAALMLGLVVTGVILILGSEPELFLPFIVISLLMFIIPGLAAASAGLFGRELFRLGGPRHDDLLKEYDYRIKHRIN